MHSLARHSTITRRGILVGVASTGAAFALRARPSEPSPIALPTNRDFGGSPLITSPDTLSAELTSVKPPVVLDASPLADFRDQHITGATHVWWQDTMELNSSWYGTVLKADDDQGTQTRRIRFLQLLGIDGSRPVVVYDRADGQAGARVCWFLRFLNLDASVLDGGYAAWLSMGGATSSTHPTIDDAISPQITPLEGFYLSAEQVNRRVSANTGTLIDCRTAAELTGGRFAGGTIPDAIPFDRSTILAPDYTLLPLPELVTATAGLPLTSPVYLVAETAIDCSLVWLALTIAGATSIELLDGGIPQWQDTVGQLSITN
jgi:thiosulfate/3-mercaptopyruvate sulfurtransferase